MSDWERWWDYPGLLSLDWGTAAAFIVLLAISVYFIFTPDISAELTWLLLVLFAVVALSPVAG